MLAPFDAVYSTAKNRSPNRLLANTWNVQIGQPAF